MTTLKRAVLKSYASATHRGSVQIAGSLSVWLEDIAIATDVPASDCVPGRECAVLFFTDDNPTDAVVICIYNALPSGGGGGGTLDAAYDFGGTGAGRTINATDGAVLIQNADADTNPNLELGRASADAARAALWSRITGDTNPRFELRADGRASWGAGGASAVDTVLERLAAGRLTLTDSLHVLAGTTLTNGGVGVNVAPSTFAYLYAGDNATTGLNSRFAALVDIGGTSGAPTNQVIGVGGRAVAQDNTTTLVYGLDYIAGVGSAADSITKAIGVRSQLVLSNSGFTLPEYAGFVAKAEIGRAHV